MCLIELVCIWILAHVAQLLDLQSSQRIYRGAECCKLPDCTTDTMPGQAGCCINTLSSLKALISSAEDVLPDPLALLFDPPLGPVELFPGGATLQIGQQPFAGGGSSSACAAQHDLPVGRGGLAGTLLAQVRQARWQPQWLSGQQQAGAADHGTPTGGPECLHL